MSAVSSAARSAEQEEQRAARHHDHEALDQHVRHGVERVVDQVRPVVDRPRSARPGAAAVAFSSSTASWTRRSTSLGFSPAPHEHDALDPAEPPARRRVAKIPVWGSAPIRTRPMSRTKIGTPCGASSTMFSMSSVRLDQAGAADGQRLLAHRRSRAPPAFRLLLFTASAIWPHAQLDTCRGAGIDLRSRTARPARRRWRRRRRPAPGGAAGRSPSPGAPASRMARTPGPAST